MRRFKIRDLRAPFEVLIKNVDITSRSTFSRAEVGVGHVWLQVS
jgi:hypothetical protein